MPFHSAHFNHYEKQVKAQQGTRSNKWHNDQFVPVAAVLKFARRKLEGDFPDGLRDWIDFDKKRHTYSPDNRQPIPVEVFKAILAEANRRADMDIESRMKEIRAEIGKDNPNIDAKKERLVLQGKKAQVLQQIESAPVWDSILRLMLNCGLDPIDICRIEWKHLRNLSRGFAYLDFARTKMKAKTGPIDRKTPLLPGTVASLRRLREISKTKSGLVFRNHRRAAFHRNQLAHGFNGLREAIDGGNGWSMKHLRNVGPTLGKRGKRPTDERDAFLGHAVGGTGTSRWYEGDVDEHYLTELVNLIGSAYFDGEQVE